MSSRSIFILAIACGLCAPWSAMAADDDAAALQQVKQNASQGQTPETASQVSQYVDQHQDVITAIIKGYVDYIRRIERMTAEGADGQPSLTSTSSGGTGTAATSTSSQSSSLSTQAAIGSRSGNSGAGYGSVQAGISSQAGDDAPTGASTQTDSTEASSALQQDGLQTSTAMRMSTLQTSDTLQSSHLAGYPTLPDVEPTNTVTTTNLTAAQRAYAAKIRQENSERKKELMAQPDGYFR
jgi:hypothetical protein